MYPGSYEDSLTKAPNMIRSARTIRKAIRQPVPFEVFLASYELREGAEASDGDAEEAPEALPEILDSLLSSGYSIVPISQLLLHGETFIDNTGMQCPK